MYQLADVTAEHLLLGKGERRTAERDRTYLALGFFIPPPTMSPSQKQDPHQQSLGEQQQQEQQQQQKANQQHKYLDRQQQEQEPHLNLQQQNYNVQKEANGGVSTQQLQVPSPLSSSCRADGKIATAAHSSGLFQGVHQQKQHQQHQKVSCIPAGQREEGAELLHRRADTVSSDHSQIAPDTGNWFIATAAAEQRSPALPLLQEKHSRFLCRSNCVEKRGLLLAPQLDTLADLLLPPEQLLPMTDAQRSRVYVHWKRRSAKASIAAAAAKRASFLLLRRLQLQHQQQSSSPQPAQQDVHQSCDVNVHLLQQAVRSLVLESLHIYTGLAPTESSMPPAAALPHLLQEQQQEQQGQKERTYPHTVIKQQRRIHSHLWGDTKHHVTDDDQEEEADNILLAKRAAEAVLLRRVATGIPGDGGSLAVVERLASPEAVADDHSNTHYSSTKINNETSSCSSTIDRSTGRKDSNTDRHNTGMTATAPPSLGGPAAREEGREEAAQFGEKLEYNIAPDPSVKPAASAPAALLRVERRETDVQRLSEERSGDLTLTTGSVDGISVKRCPEKAGVSCLRQASLQEILQHLFPHYSSTAIHRLHIHLRIAVISHIYGSSLARWIQGREQQQVNKQQIINSPGRTEAFTNAHTPGTDTEAVSFLSDVADSQVKRKDMPAPQHEKKISIASFVDDRDKNVEISQNMIEGVAGTCDTKSDLHSYTTEERDISRERAQTASIERLLQYAAEPVKCTPTSVLLPGLALHQHPEVLEREAALAEMLYFFAEDEEEARDFVRRAPYTRGRVYRSVFLCQATRVDFYGKSRDMIMPNPNTGEDGELEIDEEGFCTDKNDHVDWLIERYMKHTHNYSRPNTSETQSFEREKHISGSSAYAQPHGKSDTDFLKSTGTSTSRSAGCKGSSTYAAAVEAGEMIDASVLLDRPFYSEYLRDWAFLHLPEGEYLSEPLHVTGQDESGDIPDPAVVTALAGNRVEDYTREYVPGIWLYKPETKILYNDTETGSILFGSGIDGTFSWRKPVDKRTMIDALIRMEMAAEHVRKGHFTWDDNLWTRVSTNPQLTSHMSQEEEARLKWGLQEFDLSPGELQPGDHVPTGMDFLCDKIMEGKPPEYQRLMEYPDVVHNIHQHWMQRVDRGEAWLSDDPFRLSPQEIDIRDRVAAIEDAPPDADLPEVTTWQEDGK